MNETEKDNMNAIFSRGCGAYDTDAAIAFLEDRMSAVERERYEIHMNACVSCGQQQADLRALFASGESGSIPHDSTRPSAPPSFAQTRPSGGASAGRILGIVGQILAGLFVLIALLGTIALLVLAAMSQMRFQTAPANVEYTPPPPPRSSSRPSNSTGDSSLIPSDGDVPLAPGGGYTPLVRPGGAPLIPSTPSAPVVTPPGGFPATPVQPGTFPGSGPGTAPKPATPAKQSGASAEAVPADPVTPASRVEPLVRWVSLENTPEPASAVPAFRRIHNKVFRKDESGALVDTTWRTDLDLPSVEVVAGSNEYLRLLEANNGLRAYFRLSDHLILVLGNTVYRVTPRHLSAG